MEESWEKRGKVERVTGDDGSVQLVYCMIKREIDGSHCHPKGKGPVMSCLMLFGI